MAVQPADDRSYLPVTHCDEEVGRLYWAAMVMIKAVASSAAKPLVGEILQSLTPIALCIVLFQNQAAYLITLITIADC